MMVRLKIGYYAGEIRNLPVPQARAMLADGRAELVTPAERVEPPAAPPESATQSERPKPTQKKKRRAAP